jgi:hypothetical protein
VGRVGSRRGRDSSVEVWGERSARSRSGTSSFTWDRAICERVGGDGSCHRETIQWSDLERAVSGARSMRAVCVPGIYGAEHRWNHERSGRPVASLGSQRFHCYERGDPRGFFCEFDAWGSNAFDGVAQRVQSFHDASGYAEIFYCVDSDGRWHRALFSASCASIWMEPFWLLVLEISAEDFGLWSRDARLSCFKLCRQLRDCSISRPPCIIGRLSTSVAAFGCTSFALWFDKEPFIGCLGRWVPVSTTSRLCGGYSPRVVLNPGEEVGCDIELCPAVADEGSTRPPAREGGLSGKLYRQSSEYATSRARHGVPPQSPLRLRTSEGDGFDAFDFSWETTPDFYSYCAFIPSGFERSRILERSSQPATSPSYLARGVKTICDRSYRRFYDGIWGDFSSWRTGGWSQGRL